MSRDYLTAIVYCTDPEPLGKFLKYRMIKNTEEKLLKFERMISTRNQSAWYVNYYWRHLPRGENYAFRRYLRDLQ